MSMNLPRNQVLVGDCLKVLRTLSAGSVQMCVTSPPYFNQRMYSGGDAELGREKTPQEYVDNLVRLFRQVKRVLRDDGTLWLNLGDGYAANRTYQVSSTKDGPKHGPAQANGGVGSSVPEGLKAKDLIGIPWMVAFALRNDGWYLRSDIIWSKPNPMPESVTDRPTKAHEYLFLLSKWPMYYYDAEAVSEAMVGVPHAPGNKAGLDGGHMRNDYGTEAMNRVWGASGRRNRRTVWTIVTETLSEDHFAAYPKALVRPCILAGTSEAGACSSCGTPWERKVERKRVPTRPGSDTKTTGRNGKEIGNRDPQRHVTVAKTVGWGPTCGCEEATDRKNLLPCLVLDPFLGSGTSAMVAKQLHRDYIGIELNEKYCNLARRRIDKVNVGILPG